MQFVLYLTIYDRRKNIAKLSKNNFESFMSTRITYRCQNIQQLFHKLRFSQTMDLISMILFSKFGKEIIITMNCMNQARISRNVMPTIQPIACIVFFVLSDLFLVSSFLSSASFTSAFSSSFIIRFLGIFCFLFFLWFVF